MWSSAQTALKMNIFRMYCCNVFKYEKCLGISWRKATRQLYRNKSNGNQNVRRKMTSTYANEAYIKSSLVCRWVKTSNILNGRKAEERFIVQWKIMLADMRYMPENHTKIQKQLRIPEHDFSFLIRFFSFSWPIEWAKIRQHTQKRLIVISINSSQSKHSVTVHHYVYGETQNDTFI